MPRIAIYARKSTESEDRQILSIHSQVQELTAFARREGLAVVQVFQESKSAKAPGRLVFNELFKYVQEGAVDGVLCWKLDRLARNPVDGGAVIWAMEEGKLSSIRTPQRTFGNTGNDKFWMQLEFGMAKKYVDDLSDNVKRGIRAKLALGWRSGLPPLGYLNDPTARTIVKDPERFPLVRKMWDVMLTGSTTAPKVQKMASEAWGLRTRQFKQSGGKPIAVSAVYRLFRNPFYAGTLVHGGEYFAGSHEPMVTRSEFDRVQALLQRSSSPRPKVHSFAYTGLMHCGECGAAITAEHKVQRHGHRYIYYHCTRRKTGVSCHQRVIEVRELERQITAFLEKVTISERMRDWAVRQVRTLSREEQEKDTAAHASLSRRVAACEREKAELVNLRLRGLLSDDEYLSKKRDLEEERSRLQERLANANRVSQHAEERSIQLFSFASSLSARFARAGIDDRRAIVSLAGSNPTLKDGKLVFSPQRPLDLLSKTLLPDPAPKSIIEPANFGSDKRSKGTGWPRIRNWQRLVHDVRTFYRDHPGESSFKQGARAVLSPRPRGARAHRAA